MNGAAEVARSILACPDDVDLTIDGVPHAYDDAPLGLQDWAGTPAFACVPDGTLSQAGRQRRHAAMTVASPVDPGRLLLTGELRLVGTDTCVCCDRGRDVVVLDLAHVLLARAGDRVQVGLADFSDPSLQLNRGFLARTQEHVNAHHGDHLRQAVAQRVGSPYARIAGAQLSGLDARGVELQWVDTVGAHREQVRFPRPAGDAEELGTHLHRSLHPGIC